MNPGAKIRLESGHEKDVSKKGIIIDQRDFFNDCANQMKVILDRPTLYSTTLFRAMQDDRAQFANGSQAQLANASQAPQPKSLTLR